MTTSTKSNIDHDRDAAQVVRQLGAIPAWLAAALDADQVMQALNRHVPEFASGALTLRSCAIDLLHLKGAKGEWERNWTLTVADADGERRIPVRVTLTAPGLASIEQPTTSVPIESSDWQCWLPEVGLLCKRGRLKKDKELAAIKLLADAEQARPLLEQALRAQAAGYQHVALHSCAPEVLSNKPGKSAIIRYTLDFGPEGAGRGLRDTVILKAYNDDTGRNAFAGMRAVWDAGLQSSAVVTVPEPLAYLADQQATVQAPVPEERDLEKLLSTLLLSDDPTDQAALQAAFRATGVALAALHSCGATAEQITTWSDGFAEAAEQIECLRVPFPAPIAAIDQLVDRLCALEAAAPADPPVASHGAFRPEQVLVAGGQIGIIDFDCFCMAEPAYDLALFRAATLDNGLYDEHIQPRDEAEVATRRARIDALNETFLAAYAAQAPVSRQRVALWEAIFYLNDSLQCWTKPRPRDARLVVPLLERHLLSLGIGANHQNAGGNAAKEVKGANMATMQSDAAAIAIGLRKLAVLPAWLLAPLQGDRVADALRQQVPEFATGALTLTSVKIRRMNLKDGAGGRWAGTYQLSVEAPDGKRKVALRGTFTPPDLRRPEDAAALNKPQPFDTPGWRLALPELGLELKPEPPETELAAMPRLIDPAESRALLEQGIRADSPNYADLRIDQCAPEVISYKPGSRCTLRYHLTYPPELAERGWPTNVIAKTYRKDSKGRNAYDGMLALWRTPMASGDVVTLAEPLAYIPELKIMVQGPIAGDRSLEDLLKAALKTDTQEAIEEVYSYVRKVAVGLAAVHQSGVRHGETTTLDERFAEIHELIARLIEPAPGLAGAAEPLLARLEALAADQPADAAVPSHGTFTPEQVMINGQQIGFIDFDDIGMAEPALDVAQFRAMIKDNGMNALDQSLANNREIRLARLARLDMIGEVFLAEYEKHAPISRGRVALWEAWSYLRDALHFWSKVKPAEPDNGLLMLESHLRDMGIYAAAPAGDATRQPRKSLSKPTFRYVALACAVLASTWVDELAELLDFVQSIM